MRRVTGKTPEEQSIRSMWRRLAAEPGFYEYLEWMSDGAELWDRVRGLGPTILTGLPLGNWAKPQKIAWCARELGLDVPVAACWSKKKAAIGKSLTAAGETPILIDDRDWLRSKWEAMEGVFIHHTSAASSIAALDTLLDG